MPIYQIKDDQSWLLNGGPNSHTVREVMSLTVSCDQR